jgi:hypothetical protein
MPVREDFRWVEAPLPEPAAEQMLTRTLYLSLDPYQWGRRRGGAEAIGEVCHGRTVSRVIASRLAGYAEGDYVFNTNGWQRYGLTGAGISVFGYMFPRKLDPARAPLSLAVGVLGMLGLTAYAGLVVQCRPKRGETVVVSAASGGVGQVVGQIGKQLGCHVVGIAGAAPKCSFVVDELGFDACVSHLESGLPDALARACPDGIDVYFENVGGAVFDAVLPLLNPHSRVSLCGMISQYGNTDGGNPRDRWMAQGADVFERQRVDVHELRVGNYVADYQDAFLHEMGDWLRDGRIKYREDIWDGLENAPEAFRAMLEGRNFGKTLVRVADDLTRPR